MKRILTTLFLLLNTAMLFAQQVYDAALIPRELMTGATAVVRNQETRVEIRDPEHVTYFGKEAVTVLNARGERHGTISLWYNRTRQIRDIRVVVYDASGAPVGKFSQKQFEDVSVANDFSLFEDSRVKTLHPTAPDYPYTVEYTYEIRSGQSLIIPEWVPKNSLDLAVQKSSFQVTCPEGFDIRYKALNFPGRPEVGAGEKNSKIYRWSIGDLAATRPEPFSPAPSGILPSLRIAAGSFSYQGINGSFTSWDDYGKWVCDVLLKDRSALPESTVSAVRALVQNVSDPKEKARLIYGFMQEKTRYISVQIGIGGYQPAPAAEVDRLSYGDCKGLVNYTKALLDVAGIESYYTVVNAGREKQDVLPDFASMNEGNHVILCLPFKNDTTWLECTNKDIPFGFLGDFTDDRLVVACTPAGGKVLRTPRYRHTDNLQERRGRFVIDQDGHADGRMNTAFKGTQYDLRDPLMRQKASDQVAAIKQLYTIDNLEIGSLKLVQEKRSIPVVVETLQFTARDYASRTRDRMYIPVNTVNRIGGIPPATRERSNPVYIARGYTDLDEIEFEIPENYMVEYQPKETIVNTGFGTFQSTITVEGRKILYKRNLQVKEGSYPAESYPVLVKFFQAVANADDGKLILIRKG